MVAFFGMIFALVWLATVFFSGGPGFGPEMDLGPGYDSLPTPYEAPAPPTPEEAAAACRAAQNGQVPESVGGAPLAGCDLNNVDLSEAQLPYADLSRANLSNATLVNANLQSAKMALANIPGTDFTGANLRGADLFGVVANLQEEELLGVIWSNTTCPDGSNSDAHADTCVGYGM